MHGIGVFREQLEEKLDLTAWITERLRATDWIEIVAEPQLSLVAFRVFVPGKTPAELNELNRRFLGAVNDRKRIYINGAVLQGNCVARICVLSFRTHIDRMEEALEDIHAAAEELRAG